MLRCHFRCELCMNSCVVLNLLQSSDWLDSMTQIYLLECLVGQPTHALLTVWPQFGDTGCYHVKLAKSSVFIHYNVTTKLPCLYIIVRSLFILYKVYMYWELVCRGFTVAGVLSVSSRDSWSAESTGRQWRRSVFSSWWRHLWTDDSTAAAAWHSDCHRCVGSIVSVVRARGCYYVPYCTSLGGCQ